MHIIWIIITVLAVVFAAAVVILIYRIISRRERNRNQYRNQEQNVFVRNGVDIKRQVFGGEKGEYFTGSQKQPETYYVNFDAKMWRIVFDNLKTGERVYKNFTKEMRIGRMKRVQGEPEILTIEEDMKVSRRHCRIYESGDVLYLEDLKSHNHTYLNGGKIIASVLLRNGDVIKIGDTQLAVQYGIVYNRST